MRAVKRFMMVVLIMGIMLTQIGCWDRIDIEKNAFILGLGLDLPEKADQNDDMVMVTYQIALPAAMLGRQGKAMEEAAEEAVHLH